HYPARALQPRVGRAARRRVIETLPLEQVGAVHSGRDDLDQDVVRCRLRIRHVLPLKYLRAAWLGDHDRLHVRAAYAAHRYSELAATGPPSTRIAEERKE